MVPFAVTTKLKAEAETLLLALIPRYESFLINLHHCSTDRELLKITQADFESLPVKVLLELAVGTAIAILGKSRGLITPIYGSCA